MALIIDQGVEFQLSPVEGYVFKSYPYKIWKISKES
jgi:hypothetical protein